MPSWLTFFVMLNPDSVVKQNFRVPNQRHTPWAPCSKVTPWLGLGQQEPMTVGGIPISAGLMSVIFVSTHEHTAQHRPQNRNTEDIFKPCCIQNLRTERFPTHRFSLRGWMDGFSPAEPWMGISVLGYEFLDMILVPGYYSTLQGPSSFRGISYFISWH